MKRHRYVWTFRAAMLGMLFALAVCLVSLTPQALHAADQVYKARLSVHWFPKHHSAIYAQKFADECRKATNGRLDIEFFPAGQLYSVRQALTAVSTGSVELAGVLDLNFAMVNKNFMLATLGMFWKDFEQQRNFWRTSAEGQKEWDGIQNKLGIVVVCDNPVGPSCFFTTQKPLGTLESLSGLKARYITAAEKPAWKAFGSSFVHVSTAELYTSLKQGMIDAIHTVPTGIKAYALWDFLKFGQLPYVCYNDAHIVANAKWWNSLPQDIQDTVMNKVGPMISKASTDAIVAHSNEVLKEFQAQKGGQVVTMSAAEQKKLVYLYITKVWPAVGKSMNPEVYEAALKYAGHK